MSLSNSDQESRFDRQTCSIDDWNSILETNKTIKEIILENYESGKLPKEHNIPFNLGLNEVAHLLEEVNFYEPRTVRNTAPKSIRLAKGVRIPTGQPSSVTQVRQIDSGNIILTNKKLLFIGEVKTIKTPLNKIIIPEAYDDALVIRKETKNRPEFFSVSDPVLWTAAIKGAIKNM